MKHVPRFEIPGELASRLRLFVALVATWNRTVNLVSRSTSAEIWQRHVYDSLQLDSLFPPNVRDFVDLGSGAGFPGLVLAMAGDRHVHLVEADQRKAAFLREASRQLGIRATIHASRAETLKLPPTLVVTARALAPLNTLLALAAPFLDAEGICIFPKGRLAEDELTLALQNWQMTLDRIPSLTHPSAYILKIRKLHRRSMG